jgi:hypothetical protein
MVFLPPRAGSSEATKQLVAATMSSIVSLESFSRRTSTMMSRSVTAIRSKDTRDFPRYKRRVGMRRWGIVLDVQPFHIGISRMGFFAVASLQ